MTKTHFTTWIIASLVLAVTGGPAEENTDKGGRTLETAYPHLASGALTFARLSELPSGILLRANTVEFRSSELEKELAGAPAAVRPQLKKNGFFLLENLKVIPPEFSLHDWWPLILILVGVFQLVQSRRWFHFSGWFLIFLGGIFLLTVQHRFGMEWDNIWRLWPVILILLGISIIFGRGESHPVPSSGTTISSDEPVLREKIFLSGVRKEVSTSDFRGGDISVILGSAEIDLRGAKLRESGARITVSVVLGRVEIRVPADWAVELTTSAVLGPIENKTSPGLGGASKRLMVNASSVLGSVEIGN